MVDPIKMKRYEIEDKYDNTYMCKVANILLVILFGIILFTWPNFGNAANLHKEAEYVNHYCKGTVEFRNSDGTRTDCLDGNYSIEYDFSYKWYECLTQAMHYSVLNSNLPQCVLILKKKHNGNMLIGLIRLLMHLVLIFQL